MTMKHVLEPFQTMGELSRNARKQKEHKMKTNNQQAWAMSGIKRILAGLGLVAGIMLTQPVMAASPAPVDLQSCSTFAILAYSATTTTGGGIINGDVGLYPAGSQGIPPAQINGNIYNGGPIALQAQTDLTAAYNDAAGRALDRITVSGNIGGRTLAPGLYWSETSLQITGDLTLDAGGDPNAVWIFQMGSTLTTAAGGAGDPASRVILAGGAKAQNIFWQVGSSATLGTYSIFKGTIMAQISVTMDTGSAMIGRALARTGAVTFNGTGGSIPSDLPGWVAIDVTPTNGSWQLDAPAEYTGPTAGTGDLAAASAVVGEYTITYGALAGYMLPTNNNQLQVVAAGVTSLFVGVYRQADTNLAPPVVTATEGTYTNKVQISWASVPGVTGYEIWRSRINDIGTAVLIAEVPDDGSGTFLYDDSLVVQLRSYYYWGLSKTATQVSPLGLVSMGYASLAPDPNTPADIAASDMVYLPVNVTNLTPAGTVSFWLGNLGPNPLNSNEVAFDLRIGSNNASMVLLGTAQRAFTLAAGQEQLVILTAQEKRNLVVPVTLCGVMRVQVTVRHVSTLSDPNLTNNMTTAAGRVLVRASGVNSPGRSLNDYDGDGKADVAVFGDADYRWYVALSGARYGAWLDVPTWNSGFAPVPGDYDGDGVTDMAVYDRLTGWWLVACSSTGEIVSGQFGDSSYTPVPCDFDGDAITDPAIYREADGKWWGAASSGAYAPYGIAIGGAGYQMVTADYDGDALADPAVYNRTSGIWGIAFSSAGYEYMTGVFGGTGYLPASADYDGDGLVDLAIYAPATANWQILFSSSLATQGGYTWWSGVIGQVNGMPVQADYDGDGLADFALYYQATGQWRIFISAYGYLEITGTFGGPLCERVME